MREVMRQIEQNYEKSGEAKAVFRLVQKGRLTVKEGAEELNLSAAEFRKKMMEAGYVCPTRM